MSEVTDSRGSRWTWPVYVAVAAFMVFGANYYSVFDDEALSCRLYAMPMGEMVRALWAGEDPDPPLYYILQNAWVHTFGVGPFALRSLSIVLFLIGLAVIRRAGAAWFDERAGRLTLIFCALHPAHLFFGFAGRWYSAMFLMTSLLLWLTGRMVRSMRQDSGAAGESPLEVLPQHETRGWGMPFAWGVVAAGVCYTNYFGPVIAGVSWAVMLMVARGGRRSFTGRVIGCGIIAAAVYAPWVPTFWHHVYSFPRFGGDFSSAIASAARLGLTLVSGNLAGLAAWWAWGPLVVGVILVGASCLILWRKTWPVVVIVVGAILAGTISRTLLDKYAMTVSGGVCLLAGGIVSQLSAARRGHRVVIGSADDSAQLNTERAPTASWGRIVGRLAMLSLALGWIGCMYNLVTQRHWSSLRWLDPFKSVTRELYESNWSRSSPDAVCSHPAARYYFATLRVDDLHRNPVEKQMLPDWAPPRDGDAYNWLDVIRTDATEWRAAWDDQDSSHVDGGYFAKTPEAALALIEGDAPPQVITTLETTGFTDLPDWSALRAALVRRYRQATPPATFLRDEDAALKDRIDPAFRHPSWRISVTTWRLKSEVNSTTCE